MVRKIYPDNRVNNTPSVRIIIFILTIVSLTIFSGCGDLLGKTSGEDEIQLEEIDAIYDNIYINGVNVGLLDEVQALQKLNREITDKYDTKEITLTYENNEYKYTYKDFGAEHNFEEAVAEAYEYAKTGEKAERAALIEELKEKPLRIEASFTYDMVAVSDIVDMVAEEIDKMPVDAVLSRQEGVFITTPHQDGVMVDRDKTAGAVRQLIEKGAEGVVEVAAHVVNASLTEENAKKATDLLGTYSTVITGTAERNQNVYNASSKIDNYVLYPGEVFSTNYVFGEMTYANGYSMAPVIVGGVLEDGMGGGVCQVSSTLYMALLHGEISIVERQNHSQRVGYVPAACDATLAGDYIDLKFRNDTEYPLVIESFIKGKELTVNVYGYETRSPGRTLEFYSTLVETVPAPAEQLVETEELPTGVREVKTAALDGTKYNLFKLIKENGQEIGRETVNTSYYRPRRAVIRVGTGPALPEEEPVTAQEEPVEVVPEVVEEEDIPPTFPTLTDSLSEGPLLQEELEQPPIIQEP